MDAGIIVGVALWVVLLTITVLIGMAFNPKHDPVRYDKGYSPIDLQDLQK